MKEYPIGTLRPAAFRWQAFAIHLAISLVILGVLLAVLFYVWFPGYLFDTDGGWQALKVIAGVDIVLGPLLTLIAANPAKTTRELRKDFSVIAAIQICALSVGTWLAWDNRPYAMLWYDGMAYSLPWSALRNEASAREGLARVGDTQSPQRVYVELPLEPYARGVAMRDAVLRGTAPFLDGARYRVWPPPPAMTRAFSQLAEEYDADNQTALRSALARTASVPAVAVPVRSRYATYYLLMNPESGEILDRLPLKPRNELLAGHYPGRRLRELLDGAGQPLPR